ncbi:amino acid ABC transporter permease [Paroceanicella profunda]|uniref:Putative glutamine transport system permease protein GlnP n=1 Tax=Paroceanicella profunda TaxID=2579971 RepID=A0A5B8FW17_9RHOB|nr:amino acid ABC transporter permease [Paroceanicella profunda]QDL92635.1 amino acid ABC transporter permease [Paroceanicella profunda]
MTFTWTDLANYGPGFLNAAGIVFGITLCAIMVSWAAGLSVALGNRSDLAWVRGLSGLYVWFIRGTPTLIQIFLIYFGLPQFGVRISPFTAGFIALGLNSGAYVAEIIRAGLSAIPKGQMESALALGFSRRETMQRIILPQVCRIIVPPITNEAITTLKNTSLLSTITVVELTLYAQTIIARTYRPFEFYISAAIVYLALTTILSRFAAWVEKRYATLS